MHAGIDKQLAHNQFCMSGSTKTRKQLINHLRYKFHSKKGKQYGDYDKWPSQNSKLMFSAGYTVHILANKLFTWITENAISTICRRKQGYELQDLERAE